MYIWIPNSNYIDKGTHFIVNTIKHLMNTFKIIHNKINPYYPKKWTRRNTNKILVDTNKVCDLKRTYWSNRLHATLWAYRMHGGNDQDKHHSY
jgi:hypothetical protein